MEIVTTTKSRNNIRGLEEELDREGRNAELNCKELETLAGGVYRITNVRANVSGLGGGGLAGTTQLLASIA